MSVARTTFCDRIGSMRKAITQFNLHDLPPTQANKDHNDSARIIRNGLAVQCFNIFEDFVRGRTNEILAELSASGVPFTNLPDDLRWAATVDSIKAIDFQLKLRDVNDRIRYAQDQSESISSTKSPALRLAEVAFFHSSSNISKDQFRDALKAFSIDKPWIQISGLSSRLGVSGVPAETIYAGLAERRHKAAHDPRAAVTETDLKQSINDAMALAVCFDLLLSRVLGLAIKDLIAVAAGSSTLLPSHTLVQLRFIKLIAGRFGEMGEGARRCVKKHADLNALLPVAQNRAKKRGSALVIFDASGSLATWSV
ncbi:MAG: hypothetical protein KF897_13150 [Opitutaceae bacterium]|nr:hypothetical protein [Opitutaceae bacterium]